MQDLSVLRHSPLPMSLSPALVEQIEARQVKCQEADPSDLDRLLRLGGEPCGEGAASESRGMFGDSFQGTLPQGEEHMGYDFSDFQPRSPLSHLIVALGHHPS